MAAKDIINAGVGFDPGSSMFIVTRGLTPLPETTLPPPAPPPLTPSGIANALSGRFGPVSTRFRVERLSQDRVLLSDITSAVFGGVLHLDNRRATVRTVNLSIRPVNLPTEFNRATDLVRIWMDVYEPVTAQWIAFPQGIFKLDAPTESHSSNADELWSVLGSDLAFKLLQTNFDQTYVVPAGTNYVDAALAIFGDLGLTAAIPPSPLTTPIDKPWPPNTSKWTVVAALMEGINYYQPWVDALGTFRSRERVNPSTEEAAITYSSNQEPRMVSGEKPWVKAPQTARFYNRAVVSIQDVARAPASVEATNNDPASAISVAIQGTTQTKPIRADYAADLTTMTAIAEYNLWDEWGRSFIGSLNTFADPRREAHETYTLDIEDVEESAKWRVAGWDLPLTPGALMTHKLEYAAPIELTTGVIAQGGPFNFISMGLIAMDGHIWPGESVDTLFQLVVNQGSGIENANPDGVRNESAVYMNVAVDDIPLRTSLIQVGSDSAPYVLSPFLPLPVGGRPQILTVMSGFVDAVPDIPEVSGGGFTWTLLATVAIDRPIFDVDNYPTGAHGRLSVFLGTGSMPSGDVTIDPGTVWGSDATWLELITDTDVAFIRAVVDSTGENYTMTMGDTTIDWGTGMMTPENFVSSGAMIGLRVSS